MGHACSARLPFFGNSCHASTMFVIGTDVVERYFKTHAGHKGSNATRRSTMLGLPLWGALSGAPQLK